MGLELRGHVDGVDELGRILTGKQGNGMGTDSPDQVEGADPQVDAIVGVMLILIAQGDGFGGFGNQVLVGAVNDGDKSAIAGKAKDSQLSQCRERDVGRQPDVGSGGGIPIGGRVSLFCGRFQTEGGTINGAIVPVRVTMRARCWSEFCLYDSMYLEEGGEGGDRHCREDLICSDPLGEKAESYYDIPGQVTNSLPLSLRVLKGSRHHSRDAAGIS